MDRSLSLYSDPEKCTGCGLCVRDCTAGNITVREGQAVFADNCYGCGHCIAVCPQGAVKAADPACASQVLEYDPCTFDVPAENLLNFIKFRRSVRHFQKRIPDPDVLRQVIEAGRYTETSSNLQGTGYVVVTENLRKLSRMTVDSLEDLGKKTLSEPEKYPQLIIGYAQSWLRTAEKVRASDDPESFFFHAPALILVTAANPIDAGLASESMELMANALSLGVFFSGYFIRAYRNDPDIKAFLRIPEGRDVVTCMGLGYPDVKYYRTVPRKAAKITWL